MNRRAFLALAGGIAAWPSAEAARAQALPTIGFLGPSGREGFEEILDGFRDGLRDAGYIENRNVRIEFSWAEGDYNRLGGLAAELVRRRVDVLVAAGGLATALAAQQATSTVPIVFASGGDPVTHGVVASMARPGANLTGVYMRSSSLVGKRLELLHQLLPEAKALDLLANPGNVNAELEANELITAARPLGLDIRMLKAASDAEFDQAFALAAARPVKALIVGTDTYFNTRRQRMVDVATRYAVPAIYTWRAFAAAGGLMSYGSSRRDEYREVGRLTGRILGGAKPSELPVQQAAKLEFVINMKTARALGLTIPLALLGRADEVIE
jgi:putative ABC transport system substrate-binding protein